MPLRPLLFVLAIFLMAPGCAGPGPAPEPEPKTDRPEFDRDMCGDHLSYEQGYNDGYQGRQMNSRYAVNCREDLRQTSAKAYRSGFGAGKKDRMDGKAANAQQTGSGDSSSTRSGNTFNVNFGGIFNRGGATATSDQHSNPPGAAAPAVVKEWTCSYTAFGKVYLGKGSSEVEAKAKALEACSRNYNSHMCDLNECGSN